MFEDLKQCEIELPKIIIPKGYVKNCSIGLRKDEEDWIFWLCGDIVVPRLDGYAIIPVEEYDKLAAFYEEWAVKNKQEDKICE